MENNEVKTLTAVQAEAKKIEPKLDVLLRALSYELCRQRDNVVELRRANNRFESFPCEGEDHEGALEPHGVVERLREYVAEFKESNDEFTNEVQNLLSVV